MPSRRVQNHGHSLERFAGILAALILVGLVVFLLVRNERFADPNLVVALRIMLSASVAILGAAIPGFLNIEWSGKGMALRAGGALALFVLTYLITPEFVAGGPANATANQTTTGANSPAVVVNNGQLTIGGQPR